MKARRICALFFWNKIRYGSTIQAASNHLAGSLSSSCISQKHKHFKREEEKRNYSYMKTQPRENWDQAFKEMHANGDDQLLIDDVFADEAFEEFETEEK
ncbi:MAG: hypothetical protein RL762_725 [Bacteroidota bacterium]|jgi:hypothetical protein